MQPINVMIYCWDKKLRTIACPGSWYDQNIKKPNDLMSLAQTMHFLQDVFQMITIVFVIIISMGCTILRHLVQGLSEK